MTRLFVKLARKQVPVITVAPSSISSNRKFKLLSYFIFPRIFVISTICFISTWCRNIYNSFFLNGWQVKSDKYNFKVYLLLKDTSLFRNKKEILFSAFCISTKNESINNILICYKLSVFLQNLQNFLRNVLINKIFLQKLNATEIK